MAVYARLFGVRINLEPADTRRGWLRRSAALSAGSVPLSLVGEAMRTRILLTFTLDISVMGTLKREQSKEQ